jgi:hypothetical protein
VVRARVRARRTMGRLTRWGVPTMRQGWGQGLGEATGHIAYPQLTHWRGAAAAARREMARPRRRPAICMLTKCECTFPVYVLCVAAPRRGGPAVFVGVFSFCGSRVKRSSFGQK